VADTIGAFPSLQAIAHALGGTVQSGEVRCPGPGHSATDRSLSVKIDASAPDGFVVNTFSPADDPIACKDYIRERLGLPKFKTNGRRRASAEDVERLLQRAVAQPTTSSKINIVAKYDYFDADGNLLYQVLRLEPKDFRQRRPDNNGWIWKLEEARVPYRLPEILKFPDATIFVTEGEKDADNVAALGHCATTVACGKWTNDCVQALTGRDVVILEDNDDAGRKRAIEAAQALHGTAKTIRVVSLPGLPEKGDVSDWLDADPNNAKKFIDVCFTVSEWVPNINAKTETDSTESKPTPPLAWLDMSNWDNEPVPVRKWAINDRVPLNQAGLFSGEGGTGKSIIELTKDVAHVAGKDWFGSLPEFGPAFYVGAEDEADELHRRLAAIAGHYGLTFNDLIKGGLHVLCKLGQDATLCAVGKSGRVETTEFYKQLYQAAGDIKPKNISIDTLSRAFAGNEIDRVQVYAFAMHMQALAMVAGGSVTVLSHPSLQGISSGSGISGSTAWHGAFRFRQYLKGIKPDDGEQPDNDIRELAFKKNQYGPIGETIVLRYQRGLFLPEGGLSNLDKLAREVKADECFLHGLGRIIQQGRDAIAGENSPDFGPALIATLPEAKPDRIKKKELIDAMGRLLTAGKIHIGKTAGTPSKAKNCILPGPRP
jgi:RecA-family ATPase